jgi:hypothetical protein
VAPSPHRETASRTRLRLKPADSFDLIRLLARSQYDPRKAVCELVQNSLDAQARHVDIAWLTEKGVRALRIRDDGQGIFPELSRPDALHRIATTIGHSHKRSLTPAQRRELMALGKYGIGLLGFWSVGRFMVIRSRVGGGDTWCLRLQEDAPTAQLERVRPRRLAEEPTYTEVTILDLHDGAQRQIRPGRLQAYLASELRGQLLGREVDVRVHDKVARGRAVKEFLVTAQRFLGAPIPEADTLTVPGYDEARVELYLIPLEEERQGRVQLACGGTTVLDDLAEIDGTGEPRAPWSSGRIEGVIDFPHLDVAPGTRRHFQRDQAAHAFLDALAGLETRLVALLAADDQRRQQEADSSLARRIQRAFRELGRKLPEYDFFEVKSGPRAGAARDGDPSAGAESPEPAGTAPAGEADDTGDDPTLLFPPGPLEAVLVSPSRSRIPPGTIRVLKARALDADGRPAAGEIAFTWSLGGGGELAGDGAHATYTAPPGEMRATVTVCATDGARRCSAEAQIEVEDIVPQDKGIPEPTPVHAAAEGWRSRYRAEVWEYNTGHRDYVAAAATETRRLRYLMHLFAKEIVLRNFGGPAESAILERMVEVLTYLDESKNSRRGGNEFEPAG